jgi:hypothetical protein
MSNLVTIQNELKVPKGNVNKFGNYKYRSAEDILEAVKPILKKHDAQLTLSDDIVLIGSKIFCKATATLTLKDSVVVVNGFAETSEHKGMSAEQTTGTASSYSRKYALNGLFLIDETEADADSQKPQEKAPQPQVDAKEVLQITEQLKLMTSEAELVNYFNQVKPENAVIKALFTKRKAELQNGNK